MRSLVLALVLTAFAAEFVVAQPRTTISRMSCNEATALVKRDGEAMLAVGGGGTERFVADRKYCGLTEIAELRFVPTRDNPQCPIGYRCKEPSFDDWNWNWK